MRLPLHRPRSTAPSLAIASLLIISLSPADAGAQAQRERTLFLSLIDQTGEPVTDLRAQELSVLEGGVECPILKLEAITWPMKLTVLVDNGPTLGNSLVHVRNGLSGLFEELPAGVEISLLTITPQPRWIVRPTVDHQKLLAGIPLIAPDSGAPRFIDALLEASNRIEKDKRSEINHFPVIVIVGTDGPEGSAPRERDVERLAKQFAQNGVTLHVVMLGLGGQRRFGSTGFNQVQVGVSFSEMTGGKYEAIAASTRLATLLPEFGQMIARSHLRQSQQYRITCDPPTGPTPTEGITATTTRQGVNGILTLDGRIPQP